MVGGWTEVDFLSTACATAAFYMEFRPEEQRFIAAADWFRRIHEAAANDDDKEETVEGDEAENDDDKEETAEGGEQSADTRTTPPALDPDHASNPEAPVQHLPIVPCLVHGTPWDRPQMARQWRLAMVRWTR